MKKDPKVYADYSCLVTGLPVCTHVLHLQVSSLTMSPSLNFLPGCPPSGVKFTLSWVDVESRDLQAFPSILPLCVSSPKSTLTRAVWTRGMRSEKHGSAATAHHLGL